MKFEGTVVAGEGVAFVLTAAEENRLRTLLYKIGELAVKSYAVRYDDDRQHGATERTNKVVDQFKKYLFDKVLVTNERDCLALHTLGDVQNQSSAKELFIATAKEIIGDTDKSRP